MLLRHDLSSARWTVRDLTADTPAILAAAPGCVHTALETAGLLPDLFAPGAEAALAWIGEHDWIYRAEFDAPDALLAADEIELVIDSLDCLAVLRLNGLEIGRADNAFRLWRWPVRAALRTARNVLEIELASPLRAIAARAATPTERDGVRVESFVGKHTWLRRMACGHGWDWGPAFPSLGLGAMRLEAWSGNRLVSVRVDQTHSADGAVALSLTPELARTPHGAPPRYRVTLALAGQTVLTTSELLFTIPDARLWWPRGLGAQPLYDLRVELLDPAEGTVPLDIWSGRIGLRRILLVQEPDATGLGRSFGFEVNGRPFFSKGANWIPADLFPHRIPETRLTRLLATATEANMNMVRVWGGGIYESDLFYELCDQLGLLVWQDFMFACASYPAWDDAFLETVRAEAGDQIRRLRHHACLALWCGNNEIEHNFVGEKWAHEKRLWTDRVMGRADYDRLFREVLGGVVRELDPEKSFISASPHDPLDPTRWPGDTCGDNHYWDAWFLGVPLASQRASRHRFVSEFGFQAPPHPALLERLGADLAAPPSAPQNARLLAHHQRCHGGNAMMAVHVERECGGGGDTLAAHIARTQLTQGLALKSAIEHWRASFGRTRGALIWQMNDIWPAFSWALIDADDRAKPAYDFVRRAFAPLLIAGFEDRGAGLVRLVAVNDHPEPLRVIASWKVRSGLDGRVLEKRVEPVVKLAPDGACFDLGTVELLTHAKREGGVAKVFLDFALLAENGVDRLAEGCALLVSPGEFLAACSPQALCGDCPAIWPEELTKVVSPLLVR